MKSAPRATRWLDRSGSRAGAALSLVPVLVACSGNVVSREGVPTVASSRGTGGTVIDVEPGIPGGQGGCQSSVEFRDPKCSPTGGRGGATGLVSAGGTTSSGGVGGAGGASNSGGASNPGGSSGTGGAVTTPADGGVVPPTTRLRATEPGQVVAFDPNAVYVVGYVSDVGQYADPYGIAPIETTDDAALALDIFGALAIRPTDGHLLYTFDGVDSSGNAAPLPLYEFRRDEAQFDHIEAGEAIVDDAPTACALVPRGANGPNRAGVYQVALDGAVYHDCQLDDDPAKNNVRWYRADGAAAVPSIYSPIAIGAGGRTLGGADDGTYAVFDLLSGSVFATHKAADLFQNGPAEYALAVRAHDGGFWVAGGHGNYESTENVEYVDLDLTGNVVAHGAYAPFPAGVSLVSDNWTAKWTVIDGYGAYYQFARIGDEGVIVRRPMTGASSVVYRLSQYDISHAHQVMPYRILSGNTRLPL